jgi:hypothetical protein
VTRSIARTRLGRRIAHRLSKDDLGAALEVLVADLLAGVSVAPTNLSAVMRKLGIDGVAPAELAVDGELREERGRWRIYYNVRQGRERVRFTTAHEIAHAALLQREIRARGRDLERVCDMVASELLMPRATFGARLALPLQLAQVYELARAFEVSLTAAVIRCCELTDALAYSTGPDGIAWSWGVARAELREREFVDAWEHAQMTSTVDCVVVLPRRQPRSWHLQGRASPTGDHGLFLLTPLTA